MMLRACWVAMFVLLALSIRSYGLEEGKESSAAPLNMGQLLIPEPLFISSIKWRVTLGGKETAESFATLLEISLLRNWLTQIELERSGLDPREVKFSDEVFFGWNELAHKTHVFQTPIIVGEEYLLVGSHLFRVKSTDFYERLAGFFEKFSKVKDAHRRRRVRSVEHWYEDAKEIDRLGMPIVVSKSNEPRLEK